ncbi:MAG: hypothetical protein RDV48_22455 [Candidatus Eremiobacteraeota bacterium]|nr:hypothetical protein [Candidatus Eremiobacteraeota bacterium]
MKELVVRAIQAFLYDDEPLDEEEWAAIEQGRKDYAEGKAIPASVIKEKYDVRD